MTVSTGQRMHFCGRCVSGEHALHSDDWQTRHCLLQRERCECHCDCPYYRVFVDRPVCLRRRTPRYWPTSRMLARRLHQTRRRLRLL